MVSKEAETMIEEYLKKVDKSMTGASKSRKQEILKTLRSHILDALEDQKGKMPETKIVKSAIKDLGVPKTERFAEKLAPWIVIAIVCLGVFVLETVLGRGYIFTVPLFVCSFSALGIAEFWGRTIGRRFENRRIDVVGLWLVYVVVVAELFLLGLYIAFPAIGSTSILDLVVPGSILIGSFNPAFIAGLLLLKTFNALPAIGGFSLTSMVALIGGILAVLMSAFIIIAPEEFQSKMCPNCGKEVEGNAKFCWSCGEAIP
nr:zinc ribbon domain-containing protein [Candidatus Freyarchaeota archaeon]